MNPRHRFKKQLGQNFLRHVRFADRLLDRGGIGQGDVVLEIGPGDGKVTKQALNRGAYVIAIEYDYDLLAKLLMQFQKTERFSLHHGDAVDISLDAVIQEAEEELGISLEHTPIHVVGSLPYNASKKLIARFTEWNYRFPESSIFFGSMTCIIQDEVAKAYAAQPPKATYLAMKTQLFAEIKKFESIPRTQFFPVPQVAGGIVSFIPREIDTAGLSLDAIRKCMKIGFVSPRKTLYNNIKHSNKYALDAVEEAFMSLSLSPKVRPSELSLEAWLKFAIIVNQGKA